MGTYLARFDTAKKALIEAKSIDEVKAIRDKAEMLRAYAKQAKESLEMQNYCAEIKLRAERRAGEMLRAREPHPPGPEPEDRSHDVTYPPKLDDLGINKSQSSRWQKIADLNEEAFEEHIEAYKHEQKELTTASVLRLYAVAKAEEMQAQLQDQPLPEGRYKTIIVDPPWPMAKVMREVRPNQAEFDYPVMTVEQIEGFNIQSIAEQSAHVFLWTTQKFLPVAFQVFDSWAVSYIFTMVWHKAGGFQPFGLPQYNCEFVLYGRIGSPQFIETKAFPVCFAGERREHSRKPDEFYDMIRRVCQAPRLDMFSREKRDGYDQHGNEQAKFA